MKKGLLKDNHELRITEIQTILTIIYILMIGIGMLFNYKKYILFNINIFEYADLFEFLIAPFQDFNIILAAIFATIIPLTIYWGDTKIQQKFPKVYTKMNFGMNKKDWYMNLRWISFACILVYFIWESAAGYATYNQKSIIADDDISIRFLGDNHLNGKMIGKTKEVLFLLVYDQVKVVPLTSNVVEISLPENFEPILFN